MQQVWSRVSDIKGNQIRLRFQLHSAMERMTTNAEASREPTDPPSEPGVGPSSFQRVSDVTDETWREAGLLLSSRGSSLNKTFFWVLVCVVLTVNRDSFGNRTAVM